MYLGIRANTSDMIVGNILIDHGDEIAIPHYSSALGSAIYQKEPDRWLQAQGPVWRCRNTNNNKAAQDGRNAFLQEEQIRSSAHAHVSWSRT